MHIKVLLYYVNMSTIVNITSIKLQMKLVCTFCIVNIRDGYFYVECVMDINIYVCVDINNQHCNQSCNRLVPDRLFLSEWLEVVIILFVGLHSVNVTQLCSEIAIRQ